MIENTQRIQTISKVFKCSKKHLHADDLSKEQKKKYEIWCNYVTKTRNRFAEIVEHLHRRKNDIDSSGFYCNMGLKLKIPY